MTDMTPGKQRPLSPHVSIYRWSITMAMSIAHRITGCILYFATLLFGIWLVALSCGPDSFAYVDGIYSSFLGRVVLFFCTIALVHHLVGAVRHIVWDLKPCLLEKQLATKTAWATVFITLILTLIIWIIAYTIG